MPHPLAHSNRKEKTIIYTGLFASIFLLLVLFAPDLNNVIRISLIAVFAVILASSSALLLYLIMKTGSITEVVSETIEDLPVQFPPTHQEMNPVYGESVNEHLAKVGEMEKIKSNFFDQISHDLRTPLTLILSPLSQMIKNAKDEEELSQLQLMQYNGEKLLQLLDDLVEQSKMEAGFNSLDIQPQDINLVVRNIIRLLQAQFTLSQFKIDICLSQDMPLLSIDRRKLEIVLTNLFTSIIKITPDQQSIKVESLLAGRFVQIKIGSKERIPTNISNNSNQVFNLTKIKDLSGMDNASSLVLSKQLIAMHNGTLDFNATIKGTKFVISLPLGEQQLDNENIITELEEEQDVAVEFDQDRKPVLLVVEDSDQLRMFLSKILGDSYELLIATHGKEGLEMALSRIPDLIISDIMMPEMDGLELCRRIKKSEIASHIPVILLTALADLESKLEGLETGADYYLPKPFEPRELITATSNLIVQRKKLRERYSKKILLQSPELNGSGADERFLQKLIAQIDANLSHPEFKIEDIQKELGISRMQLHRKLKALTDKSATEFVRAIRLKRAAEMLEKGQESVSQVAYQVGFGSLSYFTKCFKEQFGVLPSAYNQVKNTL